MRRGVATLVALVALVGPAAASTASDTTVRGRVAVRMQTLSRDAAPAEATTSQSTSGVRSAESALETAVLSRINRVRRGRGLRALRWNKRLAAAADFHSRDMGKKGYFEHESANGAAFWRRIERFYPSRGFNSWTVGENLLWASDTYGSAFAVHEWMTSPPHRENILSRDWRELGIGAVTFQAAPGVYGGRTVTIVTADFGARTS
jgi:uncharacterized protein YkwD